MTQPSTLPTTKEEGVRSFAVFIRDVLDGQIERDLSLELWGLFTQLRATHRDYGGTPTGKLVLTLSPSWDGRQLSIAHQIAVTKPKQPRAKAIAWLTDGDNYSFTKPKDPRQGQLFDVTEPKRIAEEPPAPAVNDV